jgi:predicted PurR-regulated permease PerM
MSQDSPQETESSSLVITGPIDIRSFALAILVLFAILLMLNWAEAVLVPLVFSLLVSYSLDPIVSALERVRFPRWLSAVMLVALILGLAGYGSYTLRDQAHALLDKIPQAVQMLRFSFQNNSPSRGEGMLEKVREAAKEIQEAAKEAAEEDGEAAGKPGVIEVQVVEPGFRLGEYVWLGSLGALAFLGQLATVVMLVLFFLISGDTYKRKLVKISGSTLSEKKITVQILEDINKQIRRYLFVLVLSAVFVGILTWAAFLGIGLEQAALWGLIAGIASTIPYLGPAAVFITTTIVGMVQFGTLPLGLLVGTISLLITSIQGFWLTPWLTSRASSINAVVVFVGLLFWGWLWGPVGLIVATPILLIIKVCCDHIEDLTSIGELMGK